MRFPGPIPAIMLAAGFATGKHHGQIRKYGANEPYVAHCLRVARAVAHVGEPAISAALLHDTLEDTDTTFAELEKTFGSVIAGIVLELTDPPASVGNRAARKKIAREQIRGYYAKCIKCADIADNLPSIARHDPKFANTFLEELELLAPLLSDADPQCYAAMLAAAEEARATIMQELLRP